MFWVILSIYFSNSLFLLLSLARTHTPSHTLLCQHEQFFSGSLVSVMVQLLWRSEPGSCRSLSFWRAHRMRPCVRLPACVRLFCMLQAFSHAPLFLPCVSIKLTCRWKRNILHRSLLWCRYRRSSTDSAHICFICALCRSQHEAFSVHGNRTVAPSNSPPPPPTPVYLQLAP